MTSGRALSVKVRCNSPPEILAGSYGFKGVEIPLEVGFMDVMVSCISPRLSLPAIKKYSNIQEHIMTSQFDGTLNTDGISLSFFWVYETADHKEAIHLRFKQGIWLPAGSIIESQGSWFNYRVSKILQPVCKPVTKSVGMVPAWAGAWNTCRQSLFCKRQLLPRLVGECWWPTHDDAVGIKVLLDQRRLPDREHTCTRTRLPKFVSEKNDNLLSKLFGLFAWYMSTSPPSLALQICLSTRIYRTGQGWSKSDSRLIISFSEHLQRVFVN